MSIEMDNPQTPLELADAIGNLIDQIRLAVMIRDWVHVDKASDRASALNFELVQKLSE